MCNLAKNYIRWIEDESKKTKDQLAIRNVGKIDPQRHLMQVINIIIDLEIIENNFFCC